MIRSASASSKSTGPMSPATEMCENCAATSYRPLTFSAAGSPANLFRRLVGGKGQGIRGGCGPSSPAWWVRWESSTSLWRTCPASSVKGVSRSSLILPRWGLMRSGVLYLRVPWERPIYANESLLWPTPVAQDDNKSPAAHMAMKARMPGGVRKKPTSLNVMVKGIEQGIWPTPTASRTGDWIVDGKTKVVRASLQGAVKAMYPTPKSEVSGPDYARVDRPRSGGDDLVTAIARNSGRSTQPTRLNPEWVETLMGFPPKWTEL